MIDDVLRADAERWNAQLGPPPDLDEALDRAVADRRGNGGPPRRYRWALGGLAAAAIVAVIAGAVAVSRGGAHSERVGEPARLTQTVMHTQTVVHTQTVMPTSVILRTSFVPLTITETNTANVTPTAHKTQTNVQNRTNVVRQTQVNHVNSTAVLNANQTNQVNATVLATRQITKPVNVTNPVIVTNTGDQPTQTVTATVEVQSAAKSKPIADRTRLAAAAGGGAALLAGVMGLAVGPARRRRTH